MSLTLFRTPRSSETSSLAYLNFLSKNSRSKNLAKISLRRVEPSLIKSIAPICEAIEVVRKSSKLPNTFRIALSVPPRSVWFKEPFSSDT